MSFSFFLALPTPLKIAVVILGGFFWLGARNLELAPPPAPPAKQKADARVLEAVPAEPAKPVPARPAKALVVTVNSDGSFSLGGEKLTDAQLEARLRALVASHPGSSVSLKADALTPHQMVEGGMKLCKKAGIKHVTFASKAAKP